MPDLSLNNFGGFNILIQHTFFPLPGCSLLFKDEAEQKVFTRGSSPVIALQVLLITLSWLTCACASSLFWCSVFTAKDDFR